LYKIRAEVSTAEVAGTITIFLPRERDGKEARTSEVLDVPDEE
jgi:hypothetical protein